MAVKFLMGWESGPRRWRKMFKGVRYEVYCHELDIPEPLWTKEGSKLAANAWWTAKKSAVEMELSPEEAKFVADFHTLLAEREEEAEKVYRLNEDFLDKLAPHLFKGKNLKPSFGKHLDDWLLLKKAKAKASSMVSLNGYVKEWNELKLDGKDVLPASVDDFSEETLKNVYLAYVASKQNVSTKQKKFMFFKNFVRYLAENRIIPSLPSNFNSRMLSFEVKAVAKEAPNVVKINEYLKSLPPRLRLYCLLALNCGCNNIDIASLVHSQVDFENRTLTRKRVKTEKSENVPMVTYYLWDITLELLKSEMATNGDLLLVDPAGEPLYLVKEKSIYDKIKSQLRDFFKRKTSLQAFTLRDFRFFGADLLAKNPSFRGYADLFLGHAPASVRERHYSSNEDVQEACKYLEKVIFES